MSSVQENLSDALRERMFELGRAARAAAAVLAQTSAATKRQVLEAAARGLRAVGERLEAFDRCSIDESTEENQT